MPRCDQFSHSSFFLLYVGYSFPLGLSSKYSPSSASLQIFRVIYPLFLSLSGHFLSTHYRCWGLLLRLVIRNDTNTQAVGLLCKRDRPVAVTSTWGNTTFTRDKHPCFRRDSKASKRAAADLRIWEHSYRNQLGNIVIFHTSYGGHMSKPSHFP
jgi:hypothetical protein